jgi:hypothetical protein
VRNTSKELLADKQNAKPLTPERSQIAGFVRAVEENRQRCASDEQYCALCCAGASGQLAMLAKCAEATCARLRLEG